MAKFSLRRLLLQDFDKQYQDLMDKLAPIVNNSFESISNAFNNGLTVKDNLAAFEKDITLTAPVTTTVPIFIRSTLRQPCRMILVGNAITSKGTPPSGYPFITFENSNTEIKITNISNLTAGSTYTLTVYCFS